mmetsp:Transcript_5548/g.16547  ORF Transcript_5548/g.16547 Transcript_5548/m.16547 type:complete len:335 (+) Transcript_5548:268-1272(+)
MGAGPRTLDNQETKFKDGLLGLAMVDALAGGTATIAADGVMHPVDTVKARLQAQHESRYTGMIDCFRQIVRREGARRGLYAGLGAVLAGGIPCSMLVFSSYQTSKRLSERYFSNSPEAIRDLVSGGIGEVSGLAAYVPSEVVAKRMQISGLGPGRNYRSVFHALKVIYRTEGIRGLYSGTIPTMLRDVPCTALQFMFFERLKKLYKEFEPAGIENGSESGFALGVIGFLAGGAAAFLTNPFDVVKTRLQTQPSGCEKLYNGTLDCIMKTVREEGFFKLWRGAGARVLWVAPLSAITFSVYGKTAQLLTELRQERHAEQQRMMNVTASSVLDRRR